MSPVVRQWPFARHPDPQKVMQRGRLANLAHALPVPKHIDVEMVTWVSPATADHRPHVSHQHLHLR